jgi:hypothetical protein
VVCSAVDYALIILEELDQRGRLMRPTGPTSQFGDPACTREALAVTADTVVSSEEPAVECGTGAPPLHALTGSGDPDRSPF